MRIKKCVTCGKRKKLASFPCDSRIKSGYAGKCLECRRKYEKEYYRRSAIRRAKVAKNKKQSRVTAAKYICDYLRKHPCVDCGESDIVVLDFDHVRGIKRNTISILKNSSLKAVKEEIPKCVVRCANCHRRKTARQRGWKHKVPRKHK
jgi:hypothetical protein